MKWRAPKLGDTRGRTKFAWLPVTRKMLIGDNRETRWLCFYIVHQKWDEKWIDCYFID